MNPGTAGGGSETIVGARCAFLSNAHVGHDCRLGDDIILSSNVMLAGHCQIGDFANISGGAAAHQFVRIGAHAFVGGLSGVENDIIPYGIALGNRASLAGLNIVGLKRRGFSRRVDPRSAPGLSRAFCARRHVERARRGCRDGIRRPCRGAADSRFSARRRRAGDLHAARRQGRQRVNLAPTPRLAAAPASAEARPLAILCGGGDFPIQVAKAALQAGRNPVMVGIVGAADKRIEAFPHFWVHIGEVGKLFRSLKDARHRRNRHCRRDDAAGIRRSAARLGRLEARCPA